jgi:putative hydrolase of the HAD superfamily
VQIQAVLFDYGHTLVDFAVPDDALEPIYADMRDVLTREAKAELPEAAELVNLVARRVTQRVEDSYATDRMIELDILELFTQSLSSLGFVPRPETVRWVVESEHTALTHHLRVPPESIETLKKIHSSGLKIGIISNAHLLPYMMRRDWENLGIAPYVDASVISSEVGFRKPHLSLFERVLGDLGVASSDAVFVGDRVVDDVGGAKQAGMRAILTREFRREEVGPDDPQPDLIVDKLAQIAPYVLTGRA